MQNMMYICVVIKVNKCIPFLHMVCASSILNRTEGHFKVVFAFEGKSERQIRNTWIDVTETRLYFFQLIIRNLKIAHFFCMRCDNEA